MALPNIAVTTMPIDYRVNKHLQMVQFDGERWQKFASITTDAAKE